MAALCLVACNAGMATTSGAAPPLFAGGNRAERHEAARSIPFNKMDQDARTKAAAVINNTSIFRRMPVQIIDCDPRYFLFLVRHPEVIVNIWHLMDATEMTLTREGPVNFSAQDGVGTQGNLEFLYGDHNVHILYAEGSYTGTMTKRPIRANCLLVLNTDFISNKNGRKYVRTRMDMFVDVKNVGVELIAKTFQSMIGATTDQNFVETANFITKLARTTEKNGPGVQRLAGRLTNIDQQTRFSFAEHAATVYQNAQTRNQANRRGPQPITPQSKVIATGAQSRR